MDRAGPSVGYNGGAAEVFGWRILSSRIPEPVKLGTLWIVTPTPDLGAPVLLWQPMFPRNGANIDRSLVNPEIDVQGALLSRLIAPRGLQPNS